MQLEELGDRIGIVHLHLEIQNQRANTTEQPAADRWRGLAESINPALTWVEDWAQYAAVLDSAAADGIDVATELPTMMSARAAEPAVTSDPVAPASRPAPSSSARTETPPPAPSPAQAQEMAAAAGYSPANPPPGGRGR